MTHDTTPEIHAAGVTYETRDNIALITLDNPPVNGMGLPQRKGLMEGMSRALQDPAIIAVILRGAGKVFCGGADIREFGTPASNAEPLSRRVAELIEAADKPVIAAMHGIALGGGFEIALACHYRVAEEGTRVGLPEVNIGILPGGGGTVRLPRIAGIAPALEMILSGKQVSAAHAHKLGVIDRVVAGDVTLGAMEFAR